MEKKNTGIIVCLVIAIIIILGLGAYILIDKGIINLSNQKETQENIKESKSTKEENKTEENTDEVIYYDIEQMCKSQNEICNLSENKKINDKEYKIEITKNNSTTSEEKDKITINGAEYSTENSLDQLAILDNGLIAISSHTTTPTIYFVKYYYDNKEIKQYQSFTKFGQINTKTGVYTSCEENTANQETENNQKLNIYKYSIKENNTFEDENIGSFNTICQDQ